MLLTFEAPDDLVRAHLPSGVDCDRWHGQTFVSLVALRMLDVRVLGARIPGFTTHPQVNLRVYGRHAGEPAVSFVRELVPSRLIAAVGRLWYREPFRTARIAPAITQDGAWVRAEYRFGLDAPRHRVTVTGSRDGGAVPPLGSVEHHLTQRTRGVRTDRSGRLRTFRVEHPPWAVREVRAFHYDVDFGELYGQEWSFLNASKPLSIIFAVGSDVAVYEPG